MDKTELWLLIRKSEKMFQRRKTRRMIFTVLLYTSVIFALVYLQGQVQAENIWQMIGEYISCIFLGAITYYSNLLLWSHIFKKSQEENITLEYLKKRLKEKEQENNH